MSDFLTADQAIAALNGAAPELNTVEAETDTGAENIATDDLDDGDEDSLSDPDQGAELGDEDALDESSASEDDDEGNEENEALDESLASGATSFWDEEGKEALAGLDASVRKAIERNVSKAHTEAQKLVDGAAATRKAADSEAKTFREMRTLLEQSKSQAEKVFALRYANVDWEREYRVNPDLAARAYAEFQADKAVIDQMDAYEASARAQELELLRKEEGNRLIALGDADPTVKQLFDPERGQERQKALGQYLMNDLGISPDSLMNATAIELATAYKAMRWDQAQKAKSTMKSDKKSTPTPKMSKGLSPATPNAKIAPVKHQANRFSQTKKPEDAIALLNMLDAQPAKQRK